MDSFICKVRTPQGQITKVKMQEKDKISCIKKLKRNGMTPISVEKRWSFIKTDGSRKKQKNITAKVYSKKNKEIELNRDIKINFSNKVTIQELKKFTQEFYILKKSNFTTNHAISTIINNTNNEYLKEALRNILKDCKSGKHMYKTMKNYSNIFPLVYINFIKTGELTGNLEEALLHSIKYLEDVEKTKNRIRSEIIPGVVAFFTILFLIIISLLFGIPSLQSIVESSNTNIVLPKITLIFMNLITNLVKYWYICLAIIIIVTVIIIRYVNTEKGRYKIDYFKYSNFLFGKLTYIIEFSRLLKSIYLNLRNKMRIQDSLEIAKNFTNNTYMISKIEESISNIYVGKSWITPFENEKLLNPIIIEMIKKGAKNKSLEILERAIEYTDKEIESETNIVLKRLPEISYIVVGITLILFLIVFLIPCIHIYLGGLLFI